MHDVIAAFVMAVTLTLQAASPLPRLGPIGQRLTEGDVNEIERLVSTSGRKPWLLIGDESFSPEPRAWYVSVYLEPQVTTSSLRRGPIQVVVSQGSAPGTARKPWHVARSASWAQVAVAGRAFEEIAGERDVNRPFAAFGELSDEEVVSAITFIRTSPENPAPPPVPLDRSEAASISTDVKGSWPVSRMIRKEDSTIQIELLESEHSGQTVILRRAGGKWEITRLGGWVSG